MQTKDFDDEEPTHPMPLITMAQLVGMAPIGPDRPTRDLKVHNLFVLKTKKDAK